jgi:transposase InsO family protein
MIAELGLEYPIRELCAVLGVARSGYYRWRQGPKSQRAALNGQLLERIKKIHEAKRGIYGSPRMTQELRRTGQRCNHKRVERLMRQQGLKGCTGRKRQPKTTDSDHEQPIAPNLLRGRPGPRKADEVWVADITYVPSSEGFLFLAAVMDLYSRLIVGWSLWRRLQTAGALYALERALAQRRYPRGVIHHSDQGVQYASLEYRKVLKRCGLVASMSRKGNCYDNAAMEAFWSTLKREALEGSAQWSPDQVRRVTFEYIEAIYNRSRLHSSLGYQSPVDFENQTK